MNREEIVARGQLPRARRTTAVQLVAPALCWFAIACSDQRSQATEAAAPPARAIALIDPAELSDVEIDPTDSYVITTGVTRTVTIVESTEPFLDPSTGQEVTSLTFPEIVDSMRFEAGYDAAGSVRLNEYRGGTDAGGIAARVQIADNTATFFDAFGNTVHDSAGPMLMDALGTMDDVVVTTQAVFRADSAPLAAPASPVLARGRSSSPGLPKVERRGDRLIQTYSLDDASSGVRGQRVRQFRRSGGNWVVMDERIHTTRTDGAISYQVTESTVYPTVKWNTNSLKDSARVARRARAGSASADDVSGARATVSRSPASMPSLLVTSEPGAVEGVASELCLLCADDGGGDDDINAGWSLKPGTNVAYQHGAFSNASAWLRMDPWLSERFLLARKVNASLNWKASIESQAATLTDLLVANGGSRYLIIGHSNGGLIARRVAQKDAANGGSLVGGVVAIASPHSGLPIARYARTAVGGLLSLTLRNVLANIGGNCSSKQFSWLCGDINDVLLTLVPNIVNYAFDATIPMSGDVRPGSAFLAHLNSQPEPFFRYSVEVESQGAWKFVRMLGDWKCDPEDRCSGNHLQNTMESVYDVLRYCGSNELTKLLKPAVAERCRNVRWALNSANTTYENLIAQGDASDGLVPAKSQAYPGAAGEDRERMKNAKESHVGALKSAGVRDRLSRVISRYSTQTI